MRLLDLFCGAGGAAAGYRSAGFSDIVGVDVHPQPRYPFAFVQADALAYLAAHGNDFDAIHASPPCQRWSTATATRRAQGYVYLDLLAPCRALLIEVGRPWVIENVPAAPVKAPAVTLCGLMFGLQVFRHRLFETSFWPFAPDHPAHAERAIGNDGMVTVAGRGGWTTTEQTARARASGAKSNKTTWARAMGIDWMLRRELAQAIPPAYTHFIGRQLLAQTEAGRYAREGS